MANYTAGFKARMIQRMAGPESISANALSREVGVSQGSLSRWLREAHRVADMSRKKKTDGGKRQNRNADEKLRIVLEASQLDGEALGALLRREGIHETDLREWEAAAKAALSPTSRRSKKASPEAKELKEVKRDLRRKEKALAEVTAILALKKKIREIWGDEDDDTGTRSET